MSRIMDEVFVMSVSVEYEEHLPFTLINFRNKIFSIFDILHYHGS
jgi:hypothetical protein